MRRHVTVATTIKPYFLNLLRLSVAMQWLTDMYDHYLAVLMEYELPVLFTETGQSVSWYLARFLRILIRAVYRKYACDMPFRAAAAPHNKDLLLCSVATLLYGVLGFSIRVCSLHRDPWCWVDAVLCCNAAPCLCHPARDIPVQCLIKWFIKKRCVPGFSAYRMSGCHVVLGYHVGE